MHITLYKSSLCPRCYIAKKALLELAGNNTDLHIEEVDIITSPGKFRDAGISMIPAIKIGDEVLSSFFLRRNTIRKFVERSGLK
jgi:predicted DsbA family dithiol-disulfide isomerase